MKSSKFSQYFESGAIRILNTIIVGFALAGFFSIFGNLSLIGQIISLANEPTWSKTFIVVCQILQNFTEGNVRKCTASFSSCARVDVINYKKTLMFFFERAQITWAFVFSAHAIVKLFLGFLKSKTKEKPKLLSLSGMRGGIFIPVNNFSAQERTSSKNRHIFNFRVMAVRDIKLWTRLSKSICLF